MYFNYIDIKNDPIAKQYFKDRQFFYSTKGNKILKKSVLQALRRNPKSWIDSNTHTLLYRLPKEYKEKVEDYKLQDKFQEDGKKRKPKSNEKPLKYKMPDRLIPLENKDKTWHESWYEDREKLDIPHPFRAVILGPPNSGKSTVVKNIVSRCWPEFEKCMIVHCDPEGTKEYDDVIGVDLLNEIPSPKEFKGDEKCAVILDDLEFKTMTGDQQKALDRLFGYVSTHKNVSVCLCAQDPFNVPPCVRRCSNLWVLWKQNDLDTLGTIARKAGLTKKQMMHAFTQLPEYHDSFWIDLTSKSPYKFRKNGTLPIDIYPTE